MGALQSSHHLWRLRRRLFWPREKLEALRRQKLQALLSYCYQRIPYYQRQFKEIDAEPGDFCEPEGLARFPILEKETLRDHLKEFFDPQADRSAWIPYRSSGSTGIPLELWYHPSERLRLGYTVTRELLFDGLKPWYRLVNITEPRHSASKNRWYHRLGFMNEHFLSIYDKSELNLAELRKIRPHALIGFPSVLMLTGQQMHRDGMPLQPKLLFTLAEVLTQEDRALLAGQWGVEPIDLYGANEVGHIAFQCQRRTAYHINLDALHIEILVGDRLAGVGERGEIIVTNFDLRVVPIIRYRVGDIAQMTDGSCDCGCRFPLLDHIAGRSDGFISGSDGKVFSALEISLLLKPVEGIRQYRLIQDKPGQVHIEWVPSDQAAQPELQMRRILHERLGEQMEIAVRRVSEILPEKSGKIRTVISHLPNPFWKKAES